MRSLPAADFFAASPRPKWSAAKVAQDDLVAWARQTLEGAPIQSLTISSGTITPAEEASRCIHCDTEGAAATDDLTNIAVTNAPEGSLLLIRMANSARTVVLKNAAGGSGQLSLAYGSDVALDSTAEWVLLRLVSTTWTEIARFGIPALRQVTPKTASYAVTAHDNEKTFTNSGASAEVNFTLPAPTAGMRIRFIVAAAQTLRVTAGAGDTIRVAASVTAAAGNAANSTIGSVLDLEAIDGDQWIAIATQGSWTLT